MKLIQCVPNFSEGKDKSKVDEIIKAITQVPGIFLMDVEMDPNHNRSVVTFFGGPEAISKAAFNGAARAADIIDMRNHKGEHPRIGAADVIPFTPVLGVSIKECIDLASQLGKRLAEELSIPVYLYGLAARIPERSNLAYIRKGEYEGLSKEIAVRPERFPDFGEPKMHPTAGATAVGAREHIINFNVNLKSNDKESAAQIVRAIRTSSGGLPHLRAKDIELSDRHQMQISTVLTNYSQTGLHAVFQAIKERAEAAGVEILESELVGLVPMLALVDFALKELKIVRFDPQSQLFENKLLSLLAGGGSLSEPSSKASLEESASNGAARDLWFEGLQNFCQALAAPIAVPGGGTCAAGFGAMGLSLIEKVLLIHQRKLAKAGRDGQEHFMIQKLLAYIVPERSKLTELAKKDAQAYQAVTQAFRIPKERAAERERAIEESLKGASQIPLETMHLGIKSIEMVWPYRSMVPASMISDFKVGLYSIGICVVSAKDNVFINLESIKDEKFKATSIAQATALESHLKEFWPMLFF